MIGNQSVVFWGSFLASISLLSVNFFRWKLMGLLTPFLEPCVEALIGWTFLIVLLISVLHLFWGFKRHRARAALPLALNLFTGCLAIAIPWTNVWLDQDFRWNLASREKIVTMVQSDELHGAKIRLPFWHGYLSEGGEILCEKQRGTTAILFFTFRGILDNFSGFVYRSDDRYPAADDFGGDFKEIEKLRPHWFWVAST